MTLLKATLATTFVAGMVNAATLEERVEELEINNALNTFKFSGDLTMFYDGTEKEANSVTTTNNWTRLKFGINFNAKPSSDIQFFGRLAASKHLNAIGNDYTSNDDFGSSRSYGGSDVFVEKAYFDYTMTDWMIFSAGRLPTFDGVPYNYSYGKAKMGTYPKLAYSAILDGFAFTFKPGNFFLDQGSLDFRVIYTPFNLPTQRQGASNQKFGNGQVAASHVDMLTLMLDYQSGKLSWADNLGFIAQWIKANQFGLSKIYAGEGIDVDANQNGADNGNAQAPVSNGIAVYLPSTLKMGLDLLTLHLELDNILESGVNFSVTNYSNTITETGGICFDASNPCTAANNSLGYFTNSTYANTNEMKAEGSATLAALAWNSNMPMLMNAIIGAEYMTSDKDYGFFDFTADNVTGFYTNAGKGTHAYITLLPKNNLSFTLGYRLQEIEYSNTGTKGFGARKEVTTDDTVSTTYARLRLDF